jgi:hypothetical protein
MVASIAGQMLTQGFVDEVVRGMQAWGVTGCAVVVVPLEAGMGPPAAKFFGEREEGQVVTRNVSRPASPLQYTPSTACLRRWLTDPADIVPPRVRR